MTIDKRFEDISSLLDKLSLELSLDETEIDSLGESIEKIEYWFKYMYQVIESAINTDEIHIIRHALIDTLREINDNA